MGKRVFIWIFVCLLWETCPQELRGGGGVWQTLADGLHFAVFDALLPSSVGDSKISILQIDPQKFEFRLLTAKEHQNRSRTLLQWSREFQLTAAINAGMYQKDLLTSVGYLKNFDHINNPHMNRNNSVFVFSPVDSTLPPARLLDRTCEDFDSLRPQYRCLLQSIRMISCEGNNVWAPQPQQWSIAALGMDKAGNILFIFSRSPYSVHDFVNMLLTFPLNIRGAMYLEGGPKAGLYIATDQLTLEAFGSYETALTENNDTRAAWPIPNILGIVPRTP